MAHRVFDRGVADREPRFRFGLTGFLGYIGSRASSSSSTPEVAGSRSAEVSCGGTSAGGRAGSEPGGVVGGTEALGLSVES